jgi:hypothetical protein
VALLEDDEGRYDLATSIPGSGTVAEPGLIGIMAMP